MTETISWTDTVGAISTAVATLIILVGGFFVWLQLRGLKQQTGLSALAQITEGFRSETQRKDRLLIYQKMSQEVDLHSIDKDLYTAAHRTMVYLNGIGYLVHKGLIPSDKSLAQLVGPPTIKMWDKLNKLVKQERDRRNEKTYMIFFQELASKCQRKLPNYKPTYF